ncbi:MAG TPA: hypothetical protein PLU43_04420 [Lachnospiraceae bacterium]|nr:hypothetical protein [Lachnospiraceae bacterium]
MGSYIARELKKALKRRYTYAYVLGILILCLLANIAVMAFRTIYGTNEGTYAYNLIEYATWCFVLPYYSCIFIADMGFGKIYPNPHIKDNVTKNLSRTQIYLSKLITEVLLAIVFLVIAFILLISITALFQLRDRTICSYTIWDFTQKMVFATPLWIAGISFGNMFLFLFEDKRKAYVGFFILTFAVPRIIMQLAAEPLKLAPFKVIRTYLITQNFSLLPYPADPARNIPLTVALGFIYAAIASVIGAIVYNKKKTDYIL